MNPLVRKRSTTDDWEDICPSKVIHIRELAEHTLEIDVHRAFEIFGPIKDIVMIPKKKQALVEFENLNSAQDVVRNYRLEHVNIGGKPAKVNFSTSEHVVKKVGPGDTICTENKVLIFFIYNAVYPINIEVILKICRPHGRVARIFINRKSPNLHALVEFFSIEEAVVAKRNLNGADIYSGCCTLKIEFATTDRVNVTSNTEDTYDCDLLMMQNTQSQSLLGMPNGSRMDYPTRPGLLDNDAPMRSYDRGYAAPERDYRGGDFRRSEKPMMVPLGSGNTRFSPYDEMRMEPLTPMGTGPKVAMVYGLSKDKMNCDRLFNLCCLYGNVEKVKFLKSKEGSAMIQMGDGASVDRLLKYLHNHTVFGEVIQFQVSKQPLINNVQAPYQLPDATDSFKDFSKSKENRFTNPEFASKNRIFFPSKTLNFWNAPPNYTLEQMQLEFQKVDAPTPHEFHQLTNRQKSSSGLIQWSTVEEATESVAMCNHLMLKHEDSKFPYQLKLSFSENPIRHKREGDDETNNDQGKPQKRPGFTGRGAMQMKRGRY